MALLKFLKGNYSNLNNAAIAEGQILICGDTGEMFVDVAADKRVKIGDFITVSNLTALEALDATKVPTSRLYYVEEGNILARSNGTTWVQVNKQKTAEEMKTFLGLGSLAYLSEVAESNLNSDLAAKINAASGAQHTHDNKALLDTYTQTEADLADAVAKKHAHTFVESELNKIADGDVAKWNAAEGNAKAYADEKIAALDYTDTAVDGEYVSAVSEVDGKISVTRKALPDYSNVYEVKGEAAKVQGELNTYKEANDIALANVKATAEAAYVKPATGIAKDDLSAEVKTSLGKADTALQSHQDISHLAVKSEVETELGKKVDKTVYEGKVSELEGAIAGVKSTADAAASKTYTDGELAKKVDKESYATDKATFATKTELGDVDKKFESYRTSADQDVIDNAQNEEIAKKVNKVEGKDLIATSEIERLANVTNYDDTQVKADIAKKADAEATTNALNGKVDKVEGYSLVSDTEIARLADVDNYDDAEVRGLIADRYTKEEADGKFAIKGADAYDDEEVRGLISDNADAISALAGKVGTVEEGKTVVGLIGEEKARAEGIEGGLRTDVNTIMGDYLKAADKTELQGNIDTVSAAVERLTNGVSADEIDGVNDLINYVNTHGPEVKGMKEDITANTKAIEDEAGRADAAEKALAGRLDVLEAIDHEAYKGYADDKADAAKEAAIADAAGKYETKGTAQGIVDGLKLSETYEPIGAEGRAIAAAKTETENQVKALAGDGNTSTVKKNADDIASIMEMLTWSEF